MYGMILICGSFVVTRLLEDVSLIMSFILFLAFVIHLHVVGTLAPNVQLGRFWTLDCIGLPYFMMHICFVSLENSGRE